MQQRLLQPPLLPLFAASAGPEGRQGTQGSAGPQRPAGGRPASVAVVVFPLRAAEFEDSGSIESTSRAIPEITAAVAESGAVLAFTDLGIGQTWHALPLTVPLEDHTVSLTYAYETGSFETQAARSSGSGVAGLFEGFEVKVVIIPPAEAGKLSRVDTNDYAAVSRALSIE